MQSKGLDFLQPIWGMIYSADGLGKSRYDWEKHVRVWKLYGLNLSESEVEVTYTRYINTTKPPQNPKATDKTITEAFEAHLTPGKKF